jgi:hypothetical protein
MASQRDGAEVVSKVGILAWLRDRNDKGGRPDRGENMVRPDSIEEGQEKGSSTRVEVTDHLVRNTVGTQGAVFTGGQGGMEFRERKVNIIGRVFVPTRSKIWDGRGPTGFLERSGKARSAGHKGKVVAQSVGHGTRSGENIRNVRAVAEDKRRRGVTAT